MARRIRHAERSRSLSLLNLVDFGISCAGVGCEYSGQSQHIVLTLCRPCGCAELKSARHTRCIHMRHGVSLLAETFNETSAAPQRKRLQFHSAKTVPSPSKTARVPSARVSDPPCRRLRPGSLRAST